jgi:hypothetical protein
MADMAELIREVALPSGVGGHLYLMRMPGRFGSFAAERQQITARGIDMVVCLPPLDELHQESPEYAQAIQAGGLPWDQRMLSVPDFGAPADFDAYFAEVCAVVRTLREGRRVLIHCAAGIGRSGMTATCVLMALGMSYHDAAQNVMAAGGQLESWSQERLVRRVEERLAQGDSPCD